jgi:hypothetical protein
MPWCRQKRFPVSLQPAAAALAEWPSPPSNRNAASRDLEGVPQSPITVPLGRCIVKSAILQIATPNAVELWGVFRIWPKPHFQDTLGPSVSQEILMPRVSLMVLGFLALVPTVAAATTQDPAPITRRDTYWLGAGLGLGSEDFGQRLPRRVRCHWPATRAPGVLSSRQTAGNRLYGFANLNRTRSFGGLTLGLQIGRLR